MRHLTESDLIVRLDEPRSASEEIKSHLRECEACRARATEFEALFAGLRATEPTPLDEKSEAASRARIASRIREPAVISMRRRRWWIPAAAVASIGLLVVALSVRPGAGPELALVEEIEQRALEEAIGDLDPGADIDLAWTVEDPFDETMALELEFSELSSDEQRAILDALSSTRIEL